MAARARRSVRTALLVTALVALAGSPVASAERLVYHGPRDSMRVALTFDADMTQSMRQAVLDGEAVHYDARIIELLRQTSTPATVFVTGLWAKTYPDEVRSFAADPLVELANHSWDHRAFRTPCYGLPSLSTDSARRKQIYRTATYLRDLTGVTTHHFRFPGGCHSDSDISLVYDEGHIPVQWDVVSGDAFQSDADVIIENVLGRARGGSIVVMHLNGRPNAPKTYRALKTIIPELKARGYRFVTLSSVLTGESSEARGLDVEDHARAGPRPAHRLVRKLRVRSGCRRS